MEQDESTGPADIGLLCAQTVVLDADSGTDLIEKPWRRGRRVCHFASLRNSVLERQRRDYIASDQDYVLDKLSNFS